MVIFLNKKHINIFSLSLISICIISSLFNSNNTNFTFPLQEKYILTSNYGYRTFDNSFHDGIDCAINVNTPVYAMQNGTVTFSGFDNSGGNMIIIQYNNGYKSMYCHLSNNLKVKTNDKVTKGQIVGFVGPKYLENGKLNGYTTGVHLHFSIYLNGKSINPFSLSYN